MMHKKLLSILLVLFTSVVFAASSSNHHQHPKKQHGVKSVKKSRDYMYGKATYYGGSDGFEGKRMANGDRFYSDNINVAAHPTLPLGSKLKVTNLATHRVIYVEVTDRMPKRDKVIDLSKGGARALGMHYNGTATVELTLISNAEFEANKNTVEVEDGDDGSPH